MKKMALLLVIIIAFGVRLYKINTPLADWHSWRQADTSAVSRNFVKFGFDILHPRFDDLSNVASGIPNPLGLRFVEFPIYNFLQAEGYKLFPQINLEIWGRLISIFCSLGSIIFLYLIVKHFLNFRVAIIAALVFAVLPFNVYYSRVILPEPMMVLACLGMVYFWIEAIEETKPINFVIATLFTVAVFLLKPFGGVYLLPIVYLAFNKFKFNFRKWLPLVLLLSLSFLPFVWWRWWMSHWPEGIPAYTWLFNSNNIRFKGAFFYWIFADRIGRLILGYWGLILLGLGMTIKAEKKESWFFYCWLIGNLAYLFIIATGNVQHDYYQVLIIPIICVYVAKGIDYLLINSRKTVLMVAFVFMLAFSWYQVKDFYNINNSKMVEAGKQADRILPLSAKVVAPYGGDTAFLYQTNRQGWPVGIDIERMRENGATHYVNMNFGPETDWLIGTYCTMMKTEDFVIIDLTKKCP